jgi:hypothetical protein
MTDLGTLCSPLYFPSLTFNKLHLHPWEKKINFSMTKNKYAFNKTLSSTGILIIIIMHIDSQNFQSLEMWPILWKPLIEEIQLN